MRTEDILSGIETVLTGLATTQANVQRAQTYELEQAELPALVIAGGDDTVESQMTQSFIDWNLTVFIDIVSRGDIAAVVSELNTIRGEVHAALMGNYNLLPLDFVKYIEAVGTEQPNISIEGDKPIARQRLTYSVKYRTNWANFN